MGENLSNGHKEASKPQNLRSHNQSLVYSSGIILPKRPNQLCLLHTGTSQVFASWAAHPASKPRSLGPPAPANSPYSVRSTKKAALGGRGAFPIMNHKLLGEYQHSWAPGSASSSSEPAPQQRGGQEWSRMSLVLSQSGLGGKGLFKPSLYHFLFSRNTQF